MSVGSSSRKSRVDGSEDTRYDGGSTDDAKLILRERRTYVERATTTR